MPDYIVISELVVAREQSIPHRAEHLEYLESLKRNGSLKVAGRYKDGTGGLYVINAENIEKAEEIARNDPYHKLRLRKYTVREWERVF
ncbi:MAG: YciI family protein [Conexivisphaerales archaeon]